jgi:hypothetical protein
LNSFYGEEQRQRHIKVSHGHAVVVAAFEPWPCDCEFASTPAQDRVRQLLNILLISPPISIKVTPIDRTYHWLSLVKKGVWF